MTFVSTRFWNPLRERLVVPHYSSESPHYCIRAAVHAERLGRCGARVLAAPLATADYGELRRSTAWREISQAPREKIAITTLRTGTPTVEKISTSSGYK